MAWTFKKITETDLPILLDMVQGAACTAMVADSDSR